MADPEIHPCRSCGEPTRKPMHCGNACKIRAHRTSNPAKAALYRSREAERRRVADEARVRIVVLMNRPTLQPKPPLLNECRDCGTVVSKWQQRCQTCRVKARVAAARRVKNSPAYRVWKKANRARRRALERGAWAERFDPVEVLARDGWRCHICGARTPAKLRGSYDDRAPELDHIVPLASGGEHSRMNTACACRKCNITKGSRPMGQLRLLS